MLSPELISILKQVIASWQVIVAAIGFIIFWSIVSSTANPKPKKIKAEKTKKLKRPPPTPPVAIDKDINTDDLNLGE